MTRREGARPRAVHCCSLNRRSPKHRRVEDSDDGGTRLEARDADADDEVIAGDAVVNRPLNVAVNDARSNNPGPATGSLISTQVKALIAGTEIIFKVVEEGHGRIAPINNRGGVLEVKVAFYGINKERIKG